MSQNYDAVDMSVFIEEAERFEESDNDNKDFLKNFVIMPEKEGFIVVRLMPPSRGKKLFCTTRTHRLLKGKEKKGGRNFHCPRELVTGKNGKKFWVDTDSKNPCPICMYTRGVWSWVEAAGGRDTPEGKVHAEEYGRIKAIERYYYNAMVRVFDKKGNLERSDGPKILSIGKSLHEKIVRRAVGDPKAGLKGLGDIADLLLGRDLRIVKKLRPVTFYPYYDESDFQEPSALGDDKEQVDEWLSKMHDLGALRVLKPMDELDIALQKYTGAIPDDDTSFDMSKYQKKDLAEQVATEKKAKTAESKPAVKPAVVSSSGDDVLAEKEFLAGLGSELKTVQ